MVKQVVSVEQIGTHKRNVKDKYVTMAKNIQGAAIQFCVP